MPFRVLASGAKPYGGNYLWSLGFMGGKGAFWAKYRPFKHWGRTEIPQDLDYKPLLPPPAQGDSVAKWFSAGLEIRKSRVQVPL